MSAGYMQTSWFTMLSAAVQGSSQTRVAGELGVSPALINQVLRGGGAYGTGQASTERIERKVMDVYGQWACPYLSEGGAAKVISSAQCRGWAHREAPTGSPRDIAHWRACRECPMKSRSAPPQRRPVIPRKSKEESND